MNLKLLFILATAAFLGAQTSLQAQPAESQTQTQTQLHELVQKVQAKVEAGKNSEADFADELKTFDQLIASDKATNTEEAAEVACTKGMLYAEVLRNLDKAAETFQQAATNYPETKFGKGAEKLVAQVAAINAELKMQDEEMKQQKARFPIGEPLSDFAEKDLDGKPLSIAAFKGKVVLVDFWATWCPPCVLEVPNVIATYQKHHREGFEVIGVTSDDDRDTLNKFIKKHDGMVWPQYFDGQGSKNKLAVKYGVQLIPFAVLLNRDGKVITTDVRGEKLEPAVSAALAKK